MNKTRHIFSVVVENEAGVLSRITGLFSARGYNIESLNVAPLLRDASQSRMTLITCGDDAVIEQIRKQLEKLIPVIKVEDLTDHDNKVYGSNEAGHMEREMLLVKVRANDNSRAEALRMSEVFRAHVVDVSLYSYTFELTGKAKKLNAFLRMLQPLGIMEMTRTGPVGMRRGQKKEIQSGK
ncbi:MAG: acetolactate synthase small subunit [Mariprofundales bacterium]